MNQRMLVGGRAHSSLLAAEGVLALMRSMDAIAVPGLRHEENQGVHVALEKLIKDARKTVAELIELCAKEDEGS